MALNFRLYPGCGLRRTCQHAERQNEQASGCGRNNIHSRTPCCVPGKVAPMLRQYATSPSDDSTCIITSSDDTYSKLPVAGQDPWLLAPKGFYSHAVSYGLPETRETAGSFGTDIQGAGKTPSKSALSGDDVNPSLPPHIYL
jgi:hypothetical protein